MPNLPSGVGCAWPSTAGTIPAGFTRETTLDDRFVKQVVTAATNPGGTGGTATHTHPMPSHNHSGASHSHTGTTGNAGTLNIDSDSGITALVEQPHNHPESTDSVVPGVSDSISGTYDAATSEPPFFRVIFIKSDGTPSGIPNAAVAYFNSTTLPTGWRATDGVAGAPDMRGRFWKGAVAAGDGGGTGGTSDSHTHTIPTHSHTGGLHSHTTVSIGNSGTSGFNTGTNAAADQSHGHTGTVSSGSASSTLSGVSPGSTSADGQPPWQKLFAIQNNSGAASLPTNIICIWTGTLATIPAGWFLCDGTNATPNLLDKFVRALSVTTELGTTGGAATHAHGGGGHTHPQDSHTHTASGTSGSTTPAGTMTGRVDGTASRSGSQLGAHTHAFANVSAGAATSGTADASATANTDNRPAFTEVAFIQVLNVPPNDPTITTPIAGEIVNGAAYTLRCTTTDPEGQTWFSTWEFDRNDNVFTVIGNGTTVASGAESTLSWNTDPLARGTNYRVRAKATDTGTPATVSAYTTTGLFTIDYAPTLTSINTPVAGAAYSTTMTVDATVSDQDSAQTVKAKFDFRKGAGGFTVIGNGTTVSPGGRSTLVWDISSLTPGIDYQVRATPEDSLAVQGTAVTTGNFTIGPSLSELHADNDTDFYFAENDTARFVAEKD